MEISPNQRRKVRNWDADTVSDKIHDIAAWMEISGFTSMTNTLMFICSELDGIGDRTAAQLEKDNKEDD